MSDSGQVGECYREGKYIGRASSLETPLYESEKTVVAFEGGCSHRLASMYLCWNTCKIISNVAVFDESLRHHSARAIGSRGCKLFRMFEGSGHVI